MTNLIKKIAVLTSGGDAPGMNAGIRAVVRTALANDIEPYGVKNGFQGLVENEIEKLNHESVANCIQRGGTILKTKRYDKFKDPAVRKIAVDVLQQHEIDALVVLGGDGSFRGAKLLAEQSNIKTIGIPCTIDNDIMGTPYTIGFDTARNTALTAIDRIRDTAFSHSVNFLVEVMGRASGFLAMDVGIAGGAEFVMIPELATSTEQLIERISSRSRMKLGSIIVVAEADEAGRSFNISKDIKKAIDIDYKVCVIGHTQRGGTPTVHDRKVASLMGYSAVKFIMAGHSNKMIGYDDEVCFMTDFPDIEAGSRTLTNEQLFEINNILCDI